MTNQTSHATFVIHQQVPWMFVTARCK